MTPKTIKLIVFLALLVHGIGHFQGVIASFGVNFTKNTTVESWLLKGLGKSTNQVICFILFLVAGLTAIGAGIAFKDILLAKESWTSLALISAFFSTACLLFFPNALAMFFNKVGAILVNLAIFYSILFNGNWPSVIFQD